MISGEDLAHRLFESQNIQTFIFEPPYTDLERFDAGFRTQFFPKEDYGMIQRWVQTHCNEIGNIYLLEDFFRLCTVIVPLPAASENVPGQFSVNDSALRYFIASPFTFEHLQEDDVASLLHEVTGNPAAPSKKLLSYYAELPLVYSRDKFQSFLCALFPALFESNDMRLIYHYFSATDGYLYTEADADGVDEAYAETVKKRYEIENAMQNAVEAGDAQKAIACYKQITQTGIKPRTPNAIRNLKNFDIVLNSHLRKIMEKCGVHPFYIDEVSRNFAIAIEECTTKMQVSDLAIQMIKTYCTQIQEHRLKCYSESIQRCITYIDFHYTDYLSLQNISEKINMNASYLSSQFKKETGITLTAYINRTRINHAVPLLLQSSRSIEDIANTCGFDDMNYFSRVFKKNCGCSPSDFRRQHKK
ncbi:helix-turn-helix transcriptional regulator [Treponema sp.]|uniref:helix-turn-helix transcriptional regulator n=1 Tax=Treponema sp. TaxID=166 RepID=UPI00388F8162